MTAVTECPRYRRVPSIQTAGAKLLQPKSTSWTGIAKAAGCALLLFAGLSAAAQVGPPEILRFSPTSGPEGARVAISGTNLVGISSVRFGATEAVFEPLLPEKVVAIVPCRASSSNIVVITAQGRDASPSAFLVTNDLRIPDEVSYKAGYVNPVPAPANFNSARLWVSRLRTRGCRATNRPG